MGRALREPETNITLMQLFLCMFTSLFTGPTFQTNFKIKSEHLY